MKKGHPDNRRLPREEFFQKKKLPLLCSNGLLYENLSKTFAAAPFRIGVDESLRDTKRNRLRVLMPWNGTFHKRLEQGQLPSGGNVSGIFVCNFRGDSPERGNNRRT